jgi:hypothetical protein
MGTMFVPRRAIRPGASAVIGIIRSIADLTPRIVAKQASVLANHRYRRAAIALAKLMAQQGSRTATLSRYVALYWSTWNKTPALSSSLTREVEWEPGVLDSFDFLVDL